MDVLYDKDESFYGVLLENTTQAEIAWLLSKQEAADEAESEQLAELYPRLRLKAFETNDPLFLHKYVLAGRKNGNKLADRL